ncbi:MAG TPA: aromatic ring-hydroxylating dioxygenase subunit alpha [Acidimicrobiia bacterium]|nr:aromatic ring-hydroxylating dioxygenase subunit alpha [Acidimicrobiia bacterium]
MRGGSDGLIPKERYVSPAFLQLELERLWSRVWQVACREEQVGSVGDYCEYTIGEESLLVARAGPDSIRAFYNACLHRGTRLADGCGHADDGTLTCPFHGWRYGVDGRLLEIVDAHEFGSVPAGLGLTEVRCERWGGFVFVNLDPDAEPLLEFLDPLPGLLGPYHLEALRLRSHLTTVLPANWKVVVDAFNEAYHVQGTHPQLLPWTDDVSIEYEQLGKHAHYGRLPSARRRLRPSPRLGLADDEVDEGEILAGLVGGLGGAFLHEERALVDELRAAPPADQGLLEAYQQRRRELLRRRGVDVDGLDPEQMTSADDVYVFPNLVGPIYPGSAILFRVRPNGVDVDSAIKDTWVLEWPRPDRPWRPPEHRSYPDWRDRDWGTITNQDYANMERVQAGMKSRGFVGLRLNPRQESNLLHMHRTIDAYLDA